MLKGTVGGNRISISGLLDVSLDKRFTDLLSLTYPTSTLKLQMMLLRSGDFYTAQAHVGHKMTSVGRSVDSLIVEFRLFPVQRAGLLTMLLPSFENRLASS